MDYLYNLYNIKNRLINQKQTCGCHITTLSEYNDAEKHNYKRIEINGIIYILFPCRLHKNSFN
jgi:hypothetical protein